MMPVDRSKLNFQGKTPQQIEDTEWRVLSYEAAEDLCGILNREYEIDAFEPQPNGVYTITGRLVVSITPHEGKEGLRLRFECNRRVRYATKVGQETLYPMNDMVEFAKATFPRRYHICEWKNELLRRERCKAAHAAIKRSKDELPANIRVFCTDGGNVGVEIETVKVAPDKLPELLAALKPLDEHLGRLKTAC